MRYDTCVSAACVSAVYRKKVSWILDSKDQDSGFYKQKFLGFRNPDSFACPAPKTCYAVFLFVCLSKYFTCSEKLRYPSGNRKWLSS